MTRLIDADALKKELSDKDYITYTHEYGDAIPVEWVMSAIDNAPTVDITEQEEFAYNEGYAHGVETVRPKGEWIAAPYALDYEDDATCSLCNKTIIFGIRYNFCPNCGADMRGEEKNDT